MYNKNNKDPKIYWKLLNQLRQKEKTSVSRGRDISTSIWAKYFKELYKLPKRDKFKIQIQIQISLLAYIVRTKFTNTLPKSKDI